MKSELDRELAKLEHGNHLCLIYEDRAEQVAASASFMKAGLDRGERVTYIVADTDTASVTAALTAAGVDVARERARGALTFLTARDSYLSGGRFDGEALTDRWRRAIEEALAAGFTGWRGVGEMAWVFAIESGFDRMIEYEARLNTAFSGVAALALCLYDRRLFPPALLVDVLRVHPVAVLGEHVCANPYYEPPELFLNDPRGADRLDWMISSLRRINQAEHAIRGDSERLQRLSKQLVAAQETERHRIVRELHDEIGQALTAVKVNLQAMERLDHSEEVEDRLKDSINIVDQALDQARNLAIDLRPAILDDLGLVAALRWLVDNCVKRAGLMREFIADPPDMQLPQELATTCFRVAQETLTNLMRHARATRVCVDVRLREGELTLRITDDGVGFDVVAARKSAVWGGVGFGLLGMEERVRLAGGQIRIDSVTNQGTVVCARFPLPPVITV